MVFLIGVIGVLLAIVYQDFKFRGVYWWLFVLLIAALAAFGSSRDSWPEMMHQGAWNLLFIAAQMGCLSLYFSVKSKKWTNIFKDYLGLGDLCFLIGTAVYFSVERYILFYMASLALVLGVVMVQRTLFVQSNPKIPLAGYQAGLLLVIVLLDYSMPDLSLRQEVWISTYFKM